MQMSIESVFAQCSVQALAQGILLYHLAGCAVKIDPFELGILNCNIFNTPLSHWLLVHRLCSATDEADIGQATDYAVDRFAGVGLFAGGNDQGCAATRRL